MYAAASGAAAPVARGQVEAAAAKIGTMAADLVAAGAVPGMAIVIVHADEIVYIEGFGVRKVGDPQAVDGDTVFQIASMSKPISATVVARLVGQGVVDWDARIADLDPGFRLHDPYPTAEVTVRDLFNHRSGLPGGAGDDLEDVGFDRAHVLRQLRLVAPSSSFRAGYAYSNAGITAGAVAAARPPARTGRPSPTRCCSGRRP
jgi:CubicO group peptidase (beta-lactamase class C family)